MRTLDAESLLSLPGRTAFQCVVRTCCRGSNGRGPLEACAQSPSAFTNVPFPVPDFVFYLFAVMHHSCENDYVLSPVRPPRESLNLGGRATMRHYLLPFRPHFHPLLTLRQPHRWFGCYSNMPNRLYFNCYFPCQKYSPTLIHLSGSLIFSILKEYFLLPETILAILFIIITPPTTLYILSCFTFLHRTHSSLTCCLL